MTTRIIICLFVFLTGISNAAAKSGPVSNDDIVSINEAELTSAFRETRRVILSVDEHLTALAEALPDIAFGEPSTPAVRETGFRYELRPFVGHPISLVASDFEVSF